jgi:hypothetical protein
MDWEGAATFTVQEPEHKSSAAVVQADGDTAISTRILAAARLAGETTLMGMSIKRGGDALGVVNTRDPEAAPPQLTVAWYDVDG